MRKLLIIVLLGVLIAMPAASAERPSVKQLTAFFEDVVFGAEYAKAGASEIRKWETPVRISVSAMSGRMIDKSGGGKELKLANAKPHSSHVTLIRKHLKTLLKITGVKSESAKKVNKKPNFFIKFVPRMAMHAPFLVRGADPKMLRRLAAPGVCYFLSAAKQGRIIWATIVVNNQLAATAIDACLMEEMTQALGLPNDSDLVKPSVFNNRSQPTALNRNDLIVIRSLYDRRLKAGMTKRNAMAVARRIIAEQDKKLR
jgi:hypothetical protein